MMEDENQLLAGLRKRDPASFEKLVSTYGGRLLATATRMLGREDEARDVVQDSFISAWKHLDEFEGAAGIYTWLHRIAVNACLARLRNAKVRGEVSSSSSEIPATPAFEGLPSAWSEAGPSLEMRLAMRTSIRRALRLIPDDLRTVLLLRDVEEMSSREVAERLGVPDATVRQRLHRARTAMAELLRPELCQGPELVCGGRADLLMDYLDSALPEELKEPVSGHIASCPECGFLARGYRETIGIPKAIAELTAMDAVDPDWVAATLRATSLPG